MPDKISPSTVAGHGLPERFQDVIQTIVPAGDLDSRLVANRNLAAAFLGSAEPARALGFLERAWLLGARDVGTLRPLIKGLIAEGRAHDALDRVREAGLAAIDRDDPHDLSRCLIHYAETAFFNKYPLQDAILAQSTLRYLAKFRVVTPPRRPGGRIKIGYMMWLEDNPKAIISQIGIGISRFHDTERFEILFFSLLSRAEILAANPDFSKYLDQISSLGHRFIEAEPERTSFDRAVQVAHTMRTHEIDVMIALSQWGLHFALACLRPAPVVIGHNCGTPDIDSSIALDHYIAATGQAMSESRCNAIRCRVAYPGATEAPPVPLERHTFEIALNSVLVVSSGLKEKFSDPRYWRFLNALADARPDAQFLIIGLTDQDARGLGCDLSDELRQRSRLVGFRRDFREVLAMADIYLDTYPIGGGHAVLEAINQGIPCILRRPDPFRLASFHTNYRGISELGQDPAFALDGADEHTWLSYTVKMIDEPDERRRLAEIQSRAMLEERSDNPTYTAEIECLVRQFVDTQNRVS